MNCDSLTESAATSTQMLDGRCGSRRHCRRTQLYELRGTVEPYRRIQRCEYS